MVWHSNCNFFFTDHYRLYQGLISTLWSHSLSWYALLQPDNCTLGFQTRSFLLSSCRSSWSYLSIGSWYYPPSSFLGPASTSLCSLITLPREFIFPWGKRIWHASLHCFIGYCSYYNRSGTWLCCLMTKINSDNNQWDQASLSWLSRIG